MDVVINAQIQSPLVRTLARTKGKAESFTHHIPDNIPPCSFSKIEVNAEHHPRFNEKTRIKIPQYGYLRDVFLKFTLQDAVIDPEIVNAMKKMLTRTPLTRYEFVANFSLPVGDGNNTYGAGAGNKVTLEEIDYPNYFLGVPMSDTDATNDPKVPYLGDPEVLAILYAMFLQFMHTDNDSYYSKVIRAVLTDYRTISTDYGQFRYSPMFIPIYLNDVFQGFTLGVPRYTFDKEDPTRIRTVEFVEILPYDVMDTALTMAETLTARDTSGVRFFTSDDNEAYRFEDWQATATYDKYLAVLLCSSIHLNTHNRPIQTIYPIETFARIQRLPAEQRDRYMKMIQPQVQISPDPSKKIHRTVTCYLPLFLSSTENPSNNFDTRFVENLEIEVVMRSKQEIFHPFETKSINFKPIREYALKNLQFAELLKAKAEVTDNLVSVTEKQLLSEWHSVLKEYDMSRIGQWYRGARDTIVDTVGVQALLYYHNFHDSTSQAIRDSNYKPGVPANLLHYNTHQENSIVLSKEDLEFGRSITVPLLCNNLVMSTTVVVRRAKFTRWMEEDTRHSMLDMLPIRELTLTGSGQVLYSTNLLENPLTDAFDYELTTGKQGRPYYNNVFSQGLGNEKIWIYHIPYSFSGDMTYNSGSIAFQTINNPQLRIKCNTGAAKSQPIGASSFEREATEFEDGEFSIQVYHNYFNIIRIDSNTGAITRSLDL